MELRVIAGLHPRNPAMTYMHAINPKITLALVQNEACVEKSLWRSHRMKNCAIPPRLPGEPQGFQRKLGFGVELRVIAGLLYRNPAMTHINNMKLAICWFPPASPSPDAGQQRILGIPREGREMGKVISKVSLRFPWGLRRF